MIKYWLKSTLICLSVFLSFSLALSQSPAEEPTGRAVLDAVNRALEQNPDLPYSPYTILICFDETAPEEMRQNIRNMVGGEKIHGYEIVPGLELVSTTLAVEEAVSLVNSLPGVQYAEPDYIVRKAVTPNDTYFNLLWGLHNTGQTVNGDPGINDADINAPQAWDVFTGDPNFAVAIIDTGAQLNHPDLQANIWVNPGEIPNNGIDDDGNGRIDDVNGWDFYSGDNNPSDSDGHGTHTAGTVGAVGNNGIGVTGVNWRCKLVVLRFLGPNGGTTSNAVLAIQYCTTKGIKVSNNSWGGGGYSTSLYNAINAAKSVGHVFVAAAGNNNRNIESSPFYPASYNLDNIISVAAVNNDFGRASFSNYGATSVDLGAPGVMIASTYINSSYAYMDGTSMACPHVAGVVALVYGQNPGWTYSQVRNRILSTTRPVSSMSGITVTGGVVNAQAAVTATNTPPTVSITAPANGATLTQSTSVTFTGSAIDTQDGNLSASLTWSSNLQGNIGSGASFSTSSLQLGTHTITASVTDSGGLQGSANITVNVVNTAPAVTISSPANNSSTSFGSSVTFTGSAIDTQDGNLSASLTWSSNLQGNIGSGASFSTSSLQVGTHTITARATDSGGLQGTATVTITVQQVVPAGPTNLTVSHSNGQVQCNWNDNSNNEDGFTVAREVNLGGVWSNRERFTLPANTTSFTDTPPGDGLYRYRVHAFNSAGTSTTSGWVQVTVINQSVPNAPSNLTVVYSNGQVMCQWTDNSNNEDGFTMVREVRINGVWVNRERFDLPANTTAFSDVPPGPGTYRYRVHAYNQAGTSTTSGWKQVIVP